MFAFMRATLFPLSEYQKIFFPQQWLEEQKTEEQKEDGEPGSKRPKVKKLADFWSVAEVELSSAVHCGEFMRLLHAAFESNIGRHRQSVPFMDLVEVAGLTHGNILTQISHGHVELARTFVQILAKSKLFLVGQYNTRSAKIIMNTIRGIDGDSDLTTFDLEPLLDDVLLLDAGLLSMCMDLMWRHWTQGNMLTTMAKLGTYLGKKNMPSSIFKDLYAQARGLTKSRKNFNVKTLIPPLSEVIAPLMSGAKVDYIGQTIVDINIILSEGVASAKQLVIDILFVALRVTLDSIHLESANLSDCDETKLFEHLAQLSKLFEKSPKMPHTTLFSWWRLEKQKRLFLEPDNEFMSTAIREKSLEQESPKFKWRYELECVHWSCLAGFELEKTVARFCDFLANLPRRVVIDEESAETLIEIGPWLYETEPTLFTAGTMALLSSTGNGSLTSHFRSNNK